MSRHRPILPIHLLQPRLLPPLDAALDSAADDTLFSELIARRLGIDLTQAPQGEAQPAGGAPIRVKYATVSLLLTDGYESCQWQAPVAFVPIQLRWPLLGHAGFLQFFDVLLRGAQQEAIITPNSSFPGRYIIHRSQLP